MKRLCLAAGLTAAVLLTGAAQAAEERFDPRRPAGGFIYFSRPGATMAAHDSELRNCLEISGGGWAINPNATVSPYAGEAAVQSLLLSSAERGRRAANVEHCMVVRGWRVVRVTSSEGEALAALSQARLADTLAAWVGADAPHGEIVRVWRNDGSRADPAVVGLPSNRGGAVLSVLAMNPNAPLPPDSFKASPGGPLRHEQIAPSAAPVEGSATLVVRVTGKRKFTWGFALEREGDPRAVIALQVWEQRRSTDDPDGRTITAAVEPGRWRIRSSGPLDFCLGAPSFEVKAGEAVWLGTLNIGPTPLQPDMNLESGRRYVAAAPDLAARLRPAEWTNGSTSTCRFHYFYAMELTGFPFLPGYRGGSVAQGR